MQRVPVLNPDFSPATPAKASRVKRWLKEGKAKGVHNPLEIFTVQLLAEPSGRDTQPVSLGLDPGKNFSGIGLVTSQATLFTAHLQLPFEIVRRRLEQRRMLRRNRRYRKCRRRPARFDNRRFNKVPPSIKANRLLELRVVIELLKLYPISQMVYKVVKARGDKGFSPVMVGQFWMLNQLRLLRPTTALEGWQTSLLRTHLSLFKQRVLKAAAIPATHAVDGVALAASRFVQYQPFHTADTRGHTWSGEVQITPAPFAVIRRPPISRRQLHLMVPAIGGVRRKYGGTTTRHGFRKGDHVQATIKRRNDSTFFCLAERSGQVYRGWVSGDTATQVSVSDLNWKRIAQFSARNVQLLRRSTGLLVNLTQEARFLPRQSCGPEPPLEGAPVRKVAVHQVSLEGVSTRSIR